MTRLVLFAILLGAPLSAQFLHWGVKGGIPLNDALDASVAYKSNFHHWTLGPVVEVDLPAGFGLEADLLYRRMGYSVVGLNGDTAHNSNAFTIPVLAKYKFPGKVARLYVAAGFSFRALSDVPNLWESTSKGYVLGAGFRYNLGVVKISPELRYTHWGNDVFRMTNLSSVKNQTEFLVGITF